MVLKIIILPFISSFFPAILMVREDLKTTETLVNTAVASYFYVNGIAVNKKETFKKPVLIYTEINNNRIFEFFSHYFGRHILIYKGKEEKYSYLMHF